MLGETSKHPNTRKSAKLPMLSIQQQIDNQEVVQRMNRKIAFTKNVRHLATTLQYSEALDTPTLQDKFRVDPPLLQFTTYQANHTYQSEIKLVNISKHIQRVKLTPLKNKYFIISQVKYPREDSGDIAPGMTVTIFIRFRPINLNDYDDQLLVIVPDGSLRVPIIAKRQRCEIAWPKIIDSGHCWVGDLVKKEFTLKNQGGEATFTLINEASHVKLSENEVEVGCFKIYPSEIHLQKGHKQKVTIQFLPQHKGNYDEMIRYKSHQGEQQQIEIKLKGGAYNAQLSLEEINNEKVIQQRVHNVLYLDECELGKESVSQLKIKNLAVVQVDYFWHVEHANISIDKSKGKMLPSEIIEFNVAYFANVRVPESINIQLFLYNLPSKSLANNSITRKINGVDAIQCLSIQVNTKPILSNLSIYPLHQQIVELIYLNHPVQTSFTIQNHSTVARNYKVSTIQADQHLLTNCPHSQGIIEPGSEKKVQIEVTITQLSPDDKRCSYLVEFDNSLSQIVSMTGKVEYPDLQIDLDNREIYFGLCKTFTLIRKKATIKNTQKTAIQFKFTNLHRFYELDYYDFYVFEDEQFFKRQFNVYNSQTAQEIVDWIQIGPDSSLEVEFQLNTMDQASIDFDISLVIKDSGEMVLKVIGEVRDVGMELSRKEINLREIYKGNVYNSNKFLSKELQIMNTGPIDTAFEIVLPHNDECLIKIDPMKGIIKAKSTQRLDLILEPIKTGQFNITIPWNYFDDFKVNARLYPHLEPIITFNQQDGHKTMIKQDQLLLYGVIKGMEMNYYIKDESRVKRVRQKIEDLPQSVKMSTSSFKSSKNLHENQKLVYPMLEEMNFYNVEINQVRQLQILIENDSGLTTEYEVYAENFHTLEKPTSQLNRTQRGLVAVEEEAFSSEMGKTFMKSKALDKSQKVHLSNNKGISILCEPTSGTLHKKQTQKIVITMFNDTSGRFRDTLIIDIKDHEKKKVPIDIHIRGTPVCLSRNQLGIDFNQETPVLNLGTILQSNGLVKKNLKVVNNGPKDVQLKWLIYPYNQSNKEQEIFGIDFLEGEPGTGDVVNLKWNAIKPEVDVESPFIIEPKEKILKGRQQASFTVLIQQVKDIGSFSNLLICQPHLIDETIKTTMQSLAVIVQTESISPHLTMDIKHPNHINKFQRFAVPHHNHQTNSHNYQRKIKFKNHIRANLTFSISIQQLHSKFEYFRIVQTSTDSPATNFTNTNTNIQKHFTLVFDSILEVSIQLVANPTNLNEWPFEEKIRKDGQLVISYSNGSEQVINLVGWLYRPWLKIEMPNELSYSSENFEIDFGTVHVKNSKKLSVYLINPSKVDAKWTISYLKYHQSIKYKFEETLWTKQDYEDQIIVDEKKCFKISADSGTVTNLSIPVHYIPGTLALPSHDDSYSENHKPFQLSFLFKPESNSLYKSKFRLAVAEGQSFDLIVKGKGTFGEEFEKK